MEDNSEGEASPDSARSRAFSRYLSCPQERARAVMTAYTLLNGGNPSRRLGKTRRRGGLAKCIKARQDASTRSGFSPVGPCDDR